MQASCNLQISKIWILNVKKNSNSQRSFGLLCNSTPMVILPPTINVSDEVSSSDEEIEKGKYLVTAGGCISCHRGQTELTSETLAGGLGIDTEFGTFYAPTLHLIL